MEPTKLMGAEAENCDDLLADDSEGSEDDTDELRKVKKKRISKKATVKILESREKKEDNVLCGSTEDEAADKSNSHQIAKTSRKRSTKDIIPVRDKIKSKCKNEEKDVIPIIDSYEELLLHEDEVIKTKNANNLEILKQLLDGRRFR